MGASHSTIEEEEIAATVFDVVARICPEHAEQVTGVILEDGTDNIKRLLDEDPSELSRRIQHAARCMKSKNSKQIHKDITKPNTDVESSKDELRKHLHELIAKHYPKQDAQINYIVSKLMAMDREELQSTMNTKQRFAALLESFCKEYLLLEDDQVDYSNMCFNEKAHAAASIDDSCQDVYDKTGELLHERLWSWHPSHADLFTSILMDLDIVVIQHVLTSESVLCEKLSTIVKELRESEKITKKALADLRSELGDLIYQRVLPCSRDEDHASRVTGILLELDLLQLYTLLGDEKSLFSAVARVEDAFQYDKG